MNADDVLFSLERQWKEDHPYHDVGGSNYDYFKDMGMPELLKSIEKVDDYTVRFRLTRPEAPFLADLAMPFNIIQSAEYADQLLQAGTPEKIDTEPIGTGPFAFVGFQPDVAVRYRAFADYWGGKQPIDTLVFSITPNAAVRLTKLKAGECHVMAFPEPGRPRGDRGRSEPDASASRKASTSAISRMNTTQAAVRRRARAARRSTWRSTRRRSSRRSIRAPASSPRIRSRRRSGPTTTTSRTIPTIRPPRSS